MRLTIVEVAVVLIATTTFAAAEQGRWNHVHHVAADTKGAAAWYAQQFRGEYAVTATFDTAVFGDALVRFRTRGGPQVDANVCAVDHIAFSVENVAEKLKELEKAGSKILIRPNSPAMPQNAFVEDPWGMKIEVLEDTGHLGFHHVHLFAAKPEAVLDWYRRQFGGKRVLYAGALPAIRYNSMWLIAQKPSEDRQPMHAPIVHLSWSFYRFDEAIASIKANGVKNMFGPMLTPAWKGHRVAFIKDPGGVQIEIVEFFENER